MAKKEKYRLEALLKIKERQKRKAEIALAKAINELEDEKKKLENLEKLKEEIIFKRKKARTEMNDKVAKGSSIKESHFHLDFMTKLKDDEEKVDREIVGQKENVEEAQNKLKRARRDYVDAASELNVMEKHRELWQKKLAGKISMADNKLMNELGNTIFQTNRMKAG